MMHGATSGSGRCPCMTGRYGGVKQCRGQAMPGSMRGWCSRHEFYNGANFWRPAAERGDQGMMQRAQPAGRAVVQP